MIRSNEFHVYFRVNSLFWDPNVYGRYLAMVIVARGGGAVVGPGQRLGLALAGVSIVLWLGLATTFSQSSFAALLAGLATLAALRWSLRWTVAIGLAVGAVAALGIAVAAGESLEVDLSTDNQVNKETTGRSNLVSGGTELFADRPLWGYGSGSFSRCLPQAVAGAGAAGLGVPHRAGDGRRRAGPDRPHRLPRPPRSSLLGPLHRPPRRHARVTTEPAAVSPAGGADWGTAPRRTEGWWHQSVTGPARP